MAASDANPFALDTMLPPNPNPNQINLRSNNRRTAAAASNVGIQEVLITHSKDWWSIITEFLLVGGSLAALAYMFKSLIAQQNNDAEANRKQIAEQVKRVLLKNMQKSGRSISTFVTNTYEDSLLDLIVLPAAINIQLDDIGGLGYVKSDLTETVLVPLIYPQLTGSSRLCAPPLGVLFHGPPGTGKSMMAKAIARETNATFFNVDMSRLMSKWYGDSQKYISALFSLARKMAPSIIWIDEIDALFSQRSRSDHSADVYNKALFLSLWDGLANDIYTPSTKNSTSGGSSSSCGESAQVIILGATNRPQQVDEAFLRRMARQYEFVMPDEKTRRLILDILLKTEKVHRNLNLSAIANKTAFYSGSDLKELCKYAATLPLREYVRRRSGSKRDLMTASSSEELLGEGATRGGLGGGGGSAVNVMNVFDGSAEEFTLRAIEQKDLLIALKHIKSTMKAHSDHKAKYGTSDATSLFNGMNLFGMPSSNAAFYSRSGHQNQNNDNNNNKRESQQAEVDDDADELDVE